MTYFKSIIQSSQNAPYFLWIYPKRWKKNKPFRKISLKMLPTDKIKNSFKLHWKGLFLFVEEAPGLEIPHDSRLLTPDEIEKMFDLCVGFLRERASYCWSISRDPMRWSISTWATNTKKSTIRKRGNESDKAYLPAEVQRTRLDGRKRQRVVPLKKFPKYLRRQQKRQRQKEQDQEMGEFNERFNAEFAEVTRPSDNTGRITDC